MHIVWFSWKDRSHPLAGGAEVVSGAIMNRLVKDGHKVQHITSRHKGSRQKELIDGVEVIRSGGRYSVYAAARKSYSQNVISTPDVIIDEMNTIPFFAANYTKHAAKHALLSYQLAREVWFYQMTFPLSVIGYVIEPFMLKLLSNKYSIVLTESNSSMQDMEKFGLNNVRVFRVGMEMKPLETLPQKNIAHTVLSFGAVRPMKRTLDAVKAFELARDRNPKLRLIVAGDNSGSYGKKVINYANNSRHGDAIDIKGRVSSREKIELMKQADIILVTSIKEGWGLIVTEANSQGAPAIVYDTDGLRDSVRHGETGIVTPSGEPEAMANAINHIISNQAAYNKLRHNAWEYSKQFTFDNSYKDFMEIINDAKD